MQRKLHLQNGTLHIVNCQDYLSWCASFSAYSYLNEHVLSLVLPLTLFTSGDIAEISTRRAKGVGDKAREKKRHDILGKTIELS